MTPKVSVIVPIYNVEKYLSKCLISLLSQTLTDIEIICVNDGSTDNSLKILEEFAKNDNRLKVLSQKNMGLSIARNNGIEVATGEYIGFVDSDDWVDLDFFEKLYNAAKENDCDIAVAGFKRCGRIIKTTKIKFDEVRVYSTINEKTVVASVPEYNYVWNKIYKRDKWNFKFPEGRIFEDMVFTIKALYYLKNMVTVPNVYYYYRRRINSLVMKKDSKSKNDYKISEQELFSFAQQHNIILTNNRAYTEKEVYKLFGITILKIYHYEGVKKYKFLGFIPFLSVYS